MKTQPVVALYSLSLKASTVLDWGAAESPTADVFALSVNGFEIVGLEFYYGKRSHDSMLCAKRTSNDVSYDQIPYIKDSCDLTAKVYVFLSSQLKELGLEYFSELFGFNDEIENPIDFTFEIPIVFEADGISRV